MLEKFRVLHKKAVQDDETVQVAVSTVAEALGDTGYILVRESGPKLVVRVIGEAPEYETFRKYVAQGVETVKSGGIAFDRKDGYSDHRN